MKWKSTGRRAWLNLIGAIILLVGLGSAIWIYNTAEKDLREVLGYEQGGGSVYPVNPEDSKKYLRDMELYGGKANVLVDEFRRWFAGLWQGESLAFTIGCITIFISFPIFYAANHLPSGSESDISNKNNRGR